MKPTKHYAQALSRAGIEVLDSSRCGSGHVKFVIARPESRTITASVFGSLTPSDHRATLNFVSDAKRALRTATERWEGGNRQQ